MSKNNEFKKQIAKLTTKVAEARETAISLRQRLAAADATRVEVPPPPAVAPSPPPATPPTHRQVWREMKASNPYQAAGYLLQHAGELDAPAQSEPRGAA